MRSLTSCSRLLCSVPSASAVAAAAAAASSPAAASASSRCFLRPCGARGGPRQGGIGDPGPSRRGPARTSRSFRTPSNSSMSSSFSSRRVGFRRSMAAPAWPPPPPPPPPLPACSAPPAPPRPEASVRRRRRRHGLRAGTGGERRSAAPGTAPGTARGGGRGSPGLPACPGPAHSPVTAALPRLGRHRGHRGRGSVAGEVTETGAEPRGLGPGGKKGVAAPPQRCLAVPSPHSSVPEARPRPRCPQAAPERCQGPPTAPRLLLSLKGP